MVNNFVNREKANSQTLQKLEQQIDSKIANNQFMEIHDEYDPGKKEKKKFADKNIKIFNKMH